MPGRSAQQDPRFRFEPFDPAKHDRAGFLCEHDRLTAYLKEHASQEMKKRVAAVYVLTPGDKIIAGYFTLSQYSIDAGELPTEVARKLHVPKYDKLPATLLGRLARSQQFKGMGLGEILLMGALKRSLEHSKNVASLAIVVDAVDDKARAFCRTYGFLDLPDHPNRLFLPMKTVARLFAEGR